MRGELGRRSNLTGHVRNSVWVNQDYFFVMKFNRPVTDSLYLPMGETEKGKRIIASFDMQPGEELLMKSLSPLPA